jgi:spermidine synthase
MFAVLSFLIIFICSGLGAGISTQAFQQHGLETTIVEIDPAVYNASREYFGLVDPGEGRVHLEDAGKFVYEKVASNSNTTEPELYDIVVHDCFSGGGVPGHIFTVSFWETLKTIMSPNGVLAVVSSSRSSTP